MKIVLCSGGTGGHIFPAKALAEYLFDSAGLSSRLDIQFLTDARGRYYLKDLDKKGTNSTIKVKRVLSAQFAGKSVLQKLKALSLILLGYKFTSISFLLKRPKVVVAFGGYVSVPVLLAAYTLRIPIIIHEQNRVLGRANKLFAKAAKYIVLGFKNKDLEDKYGAKVKVLGTPVRKEFLEARKQKAQACADKNETMRLRVERLCIVVLGGSQGASVLGTEVVKAFLKLPKGLQERLVVYHQCKDAQAKEVNALWKDTLVEAHVAPFFTDVAGLLLEASLVISRAGASTISEINCVGVPAIYVPFKKAVDNHQYKNAINMQSLGAAQVITEDNLNCDNFCYTLMDLLANEKSCIMSYKAYSSFNEYVLRDIRDLIVLQRH